MEGFREDVLDLRAREEAARSWRPSSFRSLEQPPDVQDDPAYQQARERVAQGMSRAVRIGRSLGVPVDMRSHPAPAVGGPVIDVNLFEAVLVDGTGRRMNPQWVVDALNRTVGECQEAVRVERLRAWNPFYWLWVAFVFVLRIPFLLLEATGFDVAKIENHLWGRLFKVAEVVGIAYLLARLGLDSG